MSFRTITDEDLDHVRNLDGPAGTIRAKLNSLIGELAAMFNGAEPGGIGGAEFATVDDARVIGSVTTHFGRGRIRLTWAPEAEQLRGEVVIEREAFDQRDRQYWEAVYGFGMAEQGPWMPSVSGGAIPEYLKRDTKLRYWGLGASIYYAILKGPVVA